MFENAYESVLVLNVVRWSLNFAGVVLVGAAVFREWQLRGRDAKTFVRLTTGACCLAIAAAMFAAWAYLVVFAVVALVSALWLGLTVHLYDENEVEVWTWGDEELDDYYGELDEHESWFIETSRSDDE